MAKQIKCDRDGCRVLRSEMDEALRLVGKALGCKLSMGAMKFDPTNGYIRFNVEAVVNGGTSHADAQVALQCASMDYHTTVEHSGMTFTIVGINARSSRYPYSVQYGEGGKVYRWNSDWTRKMFSKTSTTELRDFLCTALGLDVRATLRTRRAS